MRPRICTRTAGALCCIEGAYHFNKKYWNQVFLDGDVDDKLLKQLIDHSVEEVLKKFTKKMRTEYEALP